MHSHVKTQCMCMCKRNVCACANAMYVHVQTAMYVHVQIHCTSTQDLHIDNVISTHTDKSLKGPTNARQMYIIDTAMAFNEHQNTMRRYAKRHSACANRDTALKSIAGLTRDISDFYMLVTERQNLYIPYIHKTRSPMMRERQDPICKIYAGFPCFFKVLGIANALGNMLECFFFQADTICVLHPPWCRALSTKNCRRNSTISPLKTGNASSTQS